MVQTESTQSDSPALGARENWWGEDPADADDGVGGHQETTGRDPAEQIARGLVLKYEQPICKRQANATPNRGFAPHFAWLFDNEPLGVDSNLDALHADNRDVELTEPELYLPRTRVDGGDFVSRAPNNARRYNPESGYVNYGEGTSTGLPEFNEDRYWQCVGLYLVRRYSASDGGGLTLTNIEEYVQAAGQYWHDPSMNSHQSLAKFVEHVRDEEQN